MDFSNFEDDFFEKGEEKKGKQKKEKTELQPQAEPPFFAKIDDEAWFKDSDRQSLLTPTNHLTSSMKFRYNVDYLFSTQKFAEAKDLALCTMNRFSDDSGLVRDMNEICYHCSVKMGDLVSALDYSSTLVKDRPKNAPYHFLMAECLYNLGSYDESIISCFYALDILPNSVSFLYLLSKCYFNSENMELANKVLNRCASLLEKTLQQKKPPWNNFFHNRLKEVEEMQLEIKMRGPLLSLPRFSTNEEVCKFEHQILAGFQLDNAELLDEPEDNPLNL